eukprot:724564-Pelagomonas_calceolata.AAC.1
MVPVSPALAQAATPSTAWLTREEARPSTSQFSSPIPNLMYFRTLRMLEILSLMHAACGLHRKTGCYSYYQSLLSHATEGINNAFWNIP